MQNRSPFLIRSPNVSAVRAADHPATIFNAAGVMQVITESNTARKSMGYYDAQGWHFMPHWLLECASTNLVKGSCFCVDSNSDGVGDYWSGNFATETLVDAFDLMGIPDAKWQRITHTFDGSEGVYQGCLDQSQVYLVGFSASTVYTFSFYVKGNFNITPGKTFQVLGRWYLDAVYVNDVTLLGTLEFTKNSSVPRRVCCIFTSPPGVNAMNLRFGYIGSSARPLAGDTIDFYITGVQIEALSFPSSFIPTTTAALTRNAESYV